MSPDIEAKVRAALREQAETITSATLRNPDLPRPRRRRLAPLVVSGMVVVGVLAGVSVGVTVGRAPAVDQDVLSAAAVRPGTTLPVSNGYANVDGIEIPVPMGWTVSEMASEPAARQLCLADQLASEDDTCTSGMVFTVAVTRAGGGAAPIATHVPDVCPGGHQIMTYEPDVRVDSRPAVKYRSQCNGFGPVADYWQLDDSSLTISTPMTEKPDKYDAIVKGVNLKNWTHRS